MRQSRNVIDAKGTRTSEPFGLGWRRIRLARRIMVLTVGALVVGAIASQAGAQATVSCGSTIASDTKLESDLTCQGPGLIVVSAILDLNGHRVFGSNTGTGIALQGTGATVVNGSIRHFAEGVDMSGVDPLVRNVTVADNSGHGVTSFFGRGAGEPSADIESSTITRNGSDGIALGLVQDTTVNASVISHNGGSGIAAELQADGSRYTNNRVVENDRYGIFADTSTSRAIGNTVSHNGLGGIHFREGDGLIFAPGYTIASNRADSNGGVGISACINDFVSGNPCAAGMIDGGGNVANHNVGGVECVNILCSRTRGLAERH